MSLLPNIQQLIDANRFEDALSELNSHIASEPDDDVALFMRGKLHWRMQNFALAVTDFETAVSINPQSGAAPALELARDVFDFYNTDLLNP